MKALFIAIYERTRLIPITTDASIIITIQDFILNFFNTANLYCFSKIIAKIIIVNIGIITISTLIKLYSAFITFSSPYDKSQVKFLEFLFKEPSKPKYEVDYTIDDLFDFCKDNSPVVAILCIPNYAAENLAPQLVELGIKPGYLFQCDLAKGISHFRVPLDEACKLYSDLKEELSGLSLPKFAVDLPGGGGKFNLDFLTEKKCVVTQNDEEYIFTKDNLLYKYPKI